MRRKIFLETDLQGAEARVVALLCKDYTTLKLFDSIDVHKLTAGMAFSLLPQWCKTVDDVTPDRFDELKTLFKTINKDQRFIGKKTRHGGNYDMGKNRHMIEVNNDAKRFNFDINISEWRAGKNLDNFHTFNPKIRQVYHEEIKEVISRTKILRNPFGRVRQFFGRVDNSLFKEAYAQIPQSTIPDHLRMAGLKIEEEIQEPEIIVESHDALLFQLWEDELESYAKVIRKHMETPIDFSDCTLSRGSIIIPCEFQVGYNYRDLKEWKLEA